MGKSTRSRQSKESISNKKEMGRARKKKRLLKLKKNLQKVIYQANISQSDTSLSIDNTVISLENYVQSENNTPKKNSSVSLQNRTQSENSTPKGKRKLSAGNIHKGKRKKSNWDNRNSVIVIADDSLTNCIDNKTCNDPSPVHCSTPKAVPQKELDFIPLFNSNNSVPQKEPDFIPLFENSNNNPSQIQNHNIEDVNNVNNDTREINDNSFVTIDLTTETLDSTANRTENTVINLDNTENDECTVVSISNASLSLSGESDVTVLNVSQHKNRKEMRNFAKGIAKMNNSEKGRLLDLLTENIFGGCCVTNNRRKIATFSKPNTSRATDTAEDTYIKEVILGQVNTRNSIGSNIYNPDRDLKKTGLRMIVIDGSNVAMQHTKGRFFSVKGLKICIDYFLTRGHTVKAFVPQFRCKHGKSTDPRLLDHLERQGLVIYTPSREIQGRLVNSYDDRYIVQCAAEFDGVIVSSDQYRDLLQENPRWRFVIENRLLPFTWVDDMIMFPKDPLGRQGPTLERFLRHSPSTNFTATSSATM